MKNNPKYFDEFNDSNDVEAESQSKSADFAAMLGESLGKSSARKFKVGDKIMGEILVLGKEDVFIGLGGQKEGIMLRRDLVDETGLCPYKVGDKLDCYVTMVSAEEIRLSKKANSRHSAEGLEEAYETKAPIQGRIVEVCKGGVKVNIKGKIAFCPISQIDTAHVEDPAEYVGRSLDFLITQITEGGKNVVVSRKRLLSAESEKNSVSFLEEHQDGAIVPGKVSRLEKFGAFIELCPGVDGLVHISEIAWSRIGDPSEVLTVGQAVTVKLMKREMVAGKMRLALSIKQVTPKEDVIANEKSSKGESKASAGSAFSKFTVGQKISGKVKKKEPFGLFVELEPGIMGLFHKSKAADRNDFQYEKVRVGDTLNVEIHEVKADERRISLGLPGNSEEGDWKNYQGNENKSFGLMGAAFAAALKKKK